MDLRDENVHSDTHTSRCEMLVQQLEDFKLAKQKLISAAATNHAAEKYNHSKVEPAVVRDASNHDLSRCWHKFVRKTSDSEERQRQSPCFCQKIGQWSPLGGIKQHGLYTWTKRRPDTPRPSGVPSEMHFRPPIMSTPVGSGDCRKHVAMGSWMRGSVDDSFDMSRSFEAESDVKTSPEHLKLITPAFLSKHSHHQANDFGDALPPAVSPISQTSVLETVYVLSEDETETNSFSPVCSCHRSPKLILCKSCGKTLTGRIRKRCQVHPKQVYLMDLLCCAQCESQDLKEV